MTGPQHYAEAERLLAVVDQRRKERPGAIPIRTPDEHTAAMVHATLALAAATALAHEGLGTAMLSSERQPWRDVAATNPNGGTA